MLKAFIFQLIFQLMIVCIIFSYIFNNNFIKALSMLIKQAP